MSLVNPIGMAMGPALGILQAETGYTALFLLSAGLGFGAILYFPNPQPAR